MKHAVKPAQFIPKSVKADVLFRRMKVSHNHFAVVLDEYGGMVGIVHDERSVRAAGRGSGR